MLLNMPKPYILFRNKNIESSEGAQNRELRPEAISPRRQPRESACMQRRCGMCAGKHCYLLTVPHAQNLHTDKNPIYLKEYLWSEAASPRLTSLSHGCPSAPTEGLVYTYTKAHSVRAKSALMDSDFKLDDCSEGRRWPWGWEGGTGSQPSRCHLPA